MRSFLFAAATLFVSLSPADAQSSVTISEPEIRSYLKENATVVAVPVRSQVDHTVSATLTLSWIDKDDKLLRNAQTSVEIRSGQNRFEVPLPLPASSIWLRLRYSLTPYTRDARAFPPQSGVVSIAQAANHVFELKATHSGRYRPGGTVVVQAQAVHPLTRQPFEDLEWNGVLMTGPQTQAPGRIDRREHGFVEFTFPLPADSLGRNANGSEVRISAGHGDYRQEIHFGVDNSGTPSAKIQTDKPLYQPGQTLHLRAIVLDEEGHAAEGAKVSLRVDDGDGERAHTAELTASKFGIIQDDWILPETAPVGTYSIELELDESSTTLARHSIRVSRYELPKFQVTVKPDRTAYLPGQTPAVTITGSYLFGKPVPRGLVKVSRSSGSHWRSADDEKDREEAPIAQGSAGDDGTFTAKLDLRRELDQLQKEPHQRFHDLSFAAYYTDPASHRTEQSRFDIRITLEPIHIYFYEGADGGPLPRRVYIATSYADGRPAVTDVEAVTEGSTIKARTNRFGVARLLLPASVSGTHLDLRANDGSGLTGKWQATTWSGSGFQNRLTSPAAFTSQVTRWTY